MAMSQATLSSGLQGLTPTMSEAEAAANLADAWDTYFSAAAAGVPYAGLPAAKSAFQAALTGMSSPGAGATALQTAVTAYWTALVTAPAAAFSGCILITPPPAIGTIAAALAPVFAANVAANASTADACDAIASVLHPINLGGTATFPPAVVQPIV